MKKRIPRVLFSDLLIEYQTINLHIRVSTDLKLVKMNFEKALQLAMKVHENQTDRYGQPYILHVIRVMMRGKSEDEKIVGLLHDVIEDTPLTANDLRNEGFSEVIIEAVLCLTRPETESYEDFIQRIKSNQLASHVKINDLEDNMDMRRVPFLTEKDLPRLNKYLKAYHELVNLK